MISTPERAYRVVIVPMAVFLTVGGAIMFMMFVILRVSITGAFPFIRSEIANRVIFALIAVWLFAVGSGLYLKSRIAWPALLAYLVLVVAVPLFGIFDPFYLSTYGYTFLICWSALDAAIAVGIYLAARPAFARQPGPRIVD